MSMSRERSESSSTSTYRSAEFSGQGDAFDQLSEHLAVYDQSHLLNHWSELTDAERRRLTEQIQSLDLKQLSTLWKQSVTAGAKPVSSGDVSPLESMSPQQHRHGCTTALEAGETLLRNGQVGVVIVAGGEGSRLGFAHPKGCFPIGPVNETTLFQIFLEKTLAASRKYDVSIPVYVMTSPTTHNETVSFLDKFDWFGVSGEARHVFCQGTLPAVDFDNRILMAGPSQLCLSPDGHGGILPALNSSGLLDSMEQTGIEHLFYCQIDNAAAPVPDPILIGLHALEQSEVSVLVTEKKSPQDRVGTAVSINGRLHVLEYTLIPDEIAAQRDETGELKFRAANTGIHLLSRRFLARCAARTELLPFHRAIKTVSHMDPLGRKIVLDEPNAVKFERFIFDLFPHARRTLLIDVDADSTFIPLKDARSTETSPASVRRKLSHLYREWLAEAGVTIPEDVTVEISPRYAGNARELRERLLNSGSQLTRQIRNGSLYLGELPDHFRHRKSG